MVAPKKPSAASRTVDMFAAPKPIDERPVEVIEEAAHVGERIPIEDDVNRMREESFKFQEFVSKSFGDHDAEQEEYRVSKKGEYYLVEALRSLPGQPNYGHTGVFVRECNLYNLTAVLVQAVRAKQAADAKK